MYKKDLYYTGAKLRPILFQIVFFQKIMVKFTLSVFGDRR